MTERILDMNKTNSQCCETEGKTATPHHHDDDETSKTSTMAVTAAGSFSPIGLQAFDVEFQNGLTLRLLQSDTNVCTTGADDTGLVLWGASVALGQFLVRGEAADGGGNHRDWLDGATTILELGSGGAVPSLIVACQQERITTSTGPRRRKIIATDYRSVTLAHVQYHSSLNPCQQLYGNSLSSLQYHQQPRRPVLETYHVDWEDGLGQERLMAQHVGRPDVILAADVIYDRALVPALVETIERFLSGSSLSDDNNGSDNKPFGTLILAARDGREGLVEFHDLMRKQFVLVHTEHYSDLDNDPTTAATTMTMSTNTTTMTNSIMPPIPNAFKENPICRGRWYGNHTIYVYRRK